MPSVPRRALVAAGLAALIALAGGLPAWVAPAAASSCSSWTSQFDPPPTIRVFRHVTGEVDTVDFRAYTKNVLSREWIGSWTTESLRSGALAVKHYAWYQVLHWRGGVNSAGACFDLRDDTYDQVYDPTQATWSSAAAAVDATWGTRVLKNGSIFPTYYNAGTANEACGVNTTGWKLWQWGYAWSDDAKRFTDMNHGRTAVHWRNVDTVDIQNGRGNLWREYGGGLPDFSVDFITKLYDLNRLTELHR